MPTMRLGSWVPTIPSAGPTSRPRCGEGPLPGASVCISLKGSKHAGCWVALECSGVSQPSQIICKLGGKGMVGKKYQR